MTWRTAILFFKRPLRRHVIQFLVLAVAENIIRLHERMDFARAFVNDRGFRVPQEAGNRIFVRIAVSAVDLNRIIRRFIGKITSLPFCQRCFPCVALSLVFHLACAVDKQPAHLIAGLHIGEHLLDKLVLADRFAECRNGYGSI